MEINEINFKNEDKHFLNIKTEIDRLKKEIDLNKVKYNLLFTTKTEKEEIEKLLKELEEKKANLEKGLSNEDLVKIMCQDIDRLERQVSKNAGFISKLKLLFWLYVIINTIIQIIILSNI